MTCGPSSTCWLSLSLDNCHGGKLKTKYELERINQYTSVTRGIHIIKIATINSDKLHLKVLKESSSTINVLCSFISSNIVVMIVCFLQGPVF